MNKLVNTSLVALVLIVVFAGVYQPGSVASADEVSETIAAEASPEAGTDQAEATLPPETPAVETPTTEPDTDEVPTDPVPTEELTEDANSPPVAEEPVVEETPIIEESVTEEAPIVEEPATEEVPIVEEPVVGETPITKEPAAEESTTEVVPGEVVNKPEQVETATAEPQADTASTPAATGCDIGDSCPALKSALATNVGVNITIYNPYSKQVMDSVTIQLWDKDTLVESFTSVGTATVDLEIGKRYRVFVFAPDWRSLVFFITPTETERDYKEFMLQANVYVLLQVIDAVTREPIEGVTITMTSVGTGSPVGARNTSWHGWWQSDYVPYMTEHRFSVSMEGYKPYPDFTLVPTMTNFQWVIELQPAEKMPLTVKIVDSHTGSPIPGASFSVYASSSNPWIEGQTSNNGEFITQPIAQQTYSINASADGYEHVTGLSFEHKTGEPLVVKLRPLSDGTITIITTDEFTGEPVADAYITVFQMVGDYEYGPEVAFGQTNAEGQWASPLLPAGNYRVDVYPTEHYSQFLTLPVTNGNVGTSVQLYPFDDVAFVDVLVSDAVTTKRVPDATVTIRQYGVVATGTTDDTGTWQPPRLPKDAYVFVVEKPGYHPTIVAKVRGPLTYHIYIDLVPLNRINYQLHLNKRCNFSCFEWLASSSTSLGLGVGHGFGPLSFQTPNEFEPVVGARVQLQDPVTFEVIAEQYSDQTGSVLFVDIYEGTYRLVITGEGLDDYVEVVSISESTVLDLTIPLAMVPYPGNLEPPPDLEIPDDNNDNETPDNDEDEETTVDDSNPNPVVPDESSNANTPDDDSDTRAQTPGENTTPGNETTDDDTGASTETPDAVTNPEVDSPVESPEPNTDVEAEVAIPDSEKSSSESENDTDGGKVVATTVASDDALVAQATGGSDSTVPAGVNQLPNTGVGPTGSRVVIAAIVILAVCGFLGAVDARRRA